MSFLSNTINGFMKRFSVCRPATPATPNAPADLNSPIGLLAHGIAVQRLDGYVHFWNKKKAEILLTLREDQAEKFKRELDIALKLNECKLDVVLNDLIGINTLRLSRCTNDIYDLVGHILTTILGIGGPPTGLLNLNGIIVFRQDLPVTLFIDPKTSGLSFLCDIISLPELVDAIAQKSILLDAAGYYNTQFIFQDGTWPIRTKSGFIIGTLLGDKTLVDKVRAAVDVLIAALSPTAVTSLISGLLKAIAINEPVTAAVQVLYTPGN